ncbi:response regulator [Bradyrhizobium sp.]|uniref:response regulator n=1 Tax=Bradyrhizobium sp. TaxID=376 RepID=UPI001DE170C6|nr:response regulator [Bradyrhizobium sp.]MBV8697397.1 response regulator [Bradyrhizobium sp.]MBV8920300.1 response regulator [Bradyrhizobium sp.]MBV9980175.1 response regulator [Bradyrhizobium sp.]
MSQFVTLLVEDDMLQRELMADLLRDEGFEVVECSTAEAAELIVATSGTELRALITDNRLSGSMSGIELAEYARERYPAMNIIVMSGKEVPKLPAHTTFLQKPFEPVHLLQAVMGRNGAGG